MRSIVVATFPDMKKEIRRKVWKQLSKKASDFSREDSETPITLEQIAKRMAGKLGHG